MVKTLLRGFAPAELCAVTLTGHARTPPSDGRAELLDPKAKSGTLSWTFNRAGDFDFACLIAGHYQAGMVGKVRVVPR